MSADTQNMRTLDPVSDVPAGTFSGGAGARRSAVDGVGERGEEGDLGSG